MGYTVNDFVPQYFEMDPASDDLLFDGTKLRNNMVVLVEEDNFRYSLEKFAAGALNELDRAQMLRYQRWAMVSDVVINMQNVSFIATYNDGSKRKINITTECGWYVKKESMSAPQEEPAQISLPVVEFDYRRSYDGEGPKKLLTPAATSYSSLNPGHFQPSGEHVGTAQVPPSFTGHPRPMADTGTIPRISWKDKDENSIEEPAHFNQTRETWEQRRGGAPVN